MRIFIFSLMFVSLSATMSLAATTYSCKVARVVVHETIETMLGLPLPNSPGVTPDCGSIELKENDTRQVAFPNCPKIAMHLSVSPNPEYSVARLLFGENSKEGYTKFGIRGRFPSEFGVNLANGKLLVIVNCVSSN